MLAHLAEDVEFEGVPLVRLVVDVLKLDCDPVLQALSVHVPAGAHTPAGSHVRVLVEFFIVAAEPALNHDFGALAIDMLVADEAPIGHTAAAIVL